MVVIMVAHYGGVRAFAEFASLDAHWMCEDGHKGKYRVPTFWLGKLSPRES